MNRLGPYRALDYTFDVHASRGLRAVLDSSLVDLRCEGVPAQTLAVRRRRHGWTVQWTESEERRTIRADEHIALHDTMSAINERAAALAARTSTVLHGGAVVIDGQGVTFVGASGAGKTTLTARAVLDGADYLCDEVTAIDRVAVLRAYPRPLGLRRVGAEALGIRIPDGPFASTYPMRVSEHGSTGDRAALRAIFLVSFRGHESGATAGAGAQSVATESATHTELERLSPATALLRLTTQTLGAATVKRTMFRRLNRLVRHIPVYGLRYSDCASALDAVRSALPR